MKPARLLLLVVAVVAGGLAAFLATRGGDAPEGTTQVTEVVREEAKERVLIASRPIGLGQRLTPNDVAWQDWPEGAIRPEYITAQAVPDAPAQVTGSVARFEIFEGEPIREAKLVRTEQGYMSAVISEGMRAVSIGVTAESASGGYIVPNDRVDVVLTRRDLGSSAATRTILNNVRVLAIGRRLGETGTTGGDEEGGDDPQSQVFEDDQIATLELAPSQAETVLNAGRMGDLALVLRSVADFGDVATVDGDRNQTIRLIRYGNENSVISSNSFANMPDPSPSTAPGGEPTMSPGPQAQAETAAETPQPQIDLR